MVDLGLNFKASNNSKTTLDLVCRKVLGLDYVPRPLASSLPYSRPRTQVIYLFLGGPPTQ